MDKQHKMDLLLAWKAYEAINDCFTLFLTGYTISVLVFLKAYKPPSVTHAGQALRHHLNP